MRTMNGWVIEGVSSGVETRRMLGSLVQRQGQTGADIPLNFVLMHSPVRN